jgi:predicted DNA-binding ribbon-helix-helix protein
MSLGRARIPPRHIDIHGHPTSIRLEPQFWYWLRIIAAEVGCSAKALIEGIVVAKSPRQNLSSAIRVYVCAYFCGAAHHVLIDPTSKLAVRVAPEGKIKFNGERSRRRAVGLLEALSNMDRGMRRPRSQQRGISDSSRPPRPRAT